EALGSAYDTIIFVILLPLGYIAAFFLALLEPLLRNASFLLSVRRLLPQRTPEEEAELLREVERNRPLVVGGFEILIVVVVAAVALVLLERVVRERRITLPEGGALERADAAGLGLGETFEELRYGERDPDRGALARARAAFATVEAAVRT